MNKFFTTLAFAIIAFSASAQYGGPRFFWDIPSIYATTPDVSMISRRVGVGAETAMNVAGHWWTTRVGGGVTFTLDPKAEEVGESFLTTPYLLLEGGAGLYRTNGKRCAQTNANAFTVMPVIGLRYNFDTRSLAPAGDTEGYGLLWGVGGEIGYFFIRDMFRNTEFVLRGTYWPETKLVSANFGFKVFLNLREMGRY
ncbi:MAG: hypothetical protein WA004_10460 [Saprospiraceae bacterium]